MSPSRTRIPTKVAAKLDDCVCLVTGASRGIGKGIAIELGRQGATVYITGTTSSQSKGTKEPDGPGTIEDTAREITEAGGQGIALLCDHSNDDDVRNVMNRIQDDYGKLDILVNNAFRLPRGGVQVLYKKFWEQTPDVWDSFHTVGLRSHFVTSAFAMPLLQAARERRPTNLPRPFIAMIGSFGGLTYTFNVAYGVGKAGVDRLAKDMAVELTPEDICVCSFWPGVVNTERTQVSVENGDWDKYVGLPLDNSESTEFTGKAIAAVATDPDNMKRTGTYQVVAEVAEEYGFTDIDGRIPPSIRSLRFLIPTYGMDEQTRSKVPSWMIPDWKLPFWLMSQGAPPSQE